MQQQSIYELINIALHELPEGSEGIASLKEVKQRLADEEFARRVGMPPSGVLIYCELAKANRGFGGRKMSEFSNAIVVDVTQLIPILKVNGYKGSPGSIWLYKYRMNEALAEYGLEVVSVNRKGYALVPKTEPVTADTE